MTAPTAHDLDAFDQWHFKRFLVDPPQWGPRGGGKDGA